MPTAPARPSSGSATSSGARHPRPDRQPLARGPGRRLGALGPARRRRGALADARQALDGRAGTDGVAARLDRAEAELLIARGDLVGALAVLDRSAKRSVTSTCGSTPAARW